MASITSGFVKSAPGGSGGASFEVEELSTPKAAAAAAKAAAAFVPATPSNASSEGGPPSRWRECCHFADALSASALGRLLKGEGVAAE